MSRTFSQLSFDERRTISRMLDQKFSQSEVAGRLGRDRATTSREVRRNYWHDSEFPDADGYWAMTPNELVNDRGVRPLFGDWSIRKSLGLAPDAA